jgi:hypothetical protein
VAHLTTYLDLESRKILRSGFDFKSNLTSAIGYLANRGFLASYLSRHKAMAYNTVKMNIPVGLSQSMNILAAPSYLSGLLVYGSYAVALRHAHCHHVPVVVAAAASFTVVAVGPVLAVVVRRAI